MKTKVFALATLALVFLVAIPARAQVGGDSRHFPETGHHIAHGFKAFWERNGDLEVFGYPLSDEFDGASPDTSQRYTMQFFERQRFEFHPGNPAPHNMLLGRLGVEALINDGRDWFTFPKAVSSAPHYFAETGHAIASQFWDHWRAHGLDYGDDGISMRESVALFGFPISEPAMESNAGGPAVLTQWFERARMEYHPNNPEPFKVLLGRVGAEMLGMRTSQPSMLKPYGDASALPVISTGDRLPNGYRFPSIPDGIGIMSNGYGTADVFVAHETSTVPFPAIGASNAAADFNNSEISRLRISQSSGGVLNGDLLWTSDLNFLRFCSAFLAGEAEGFKNPVFFTGEETNDRVSLYPNSAWPAGEPSRQAGLVVAVEARSGERYIIEGMGRMNHENTVIVPGGWKEVVAVTNDDTFTAPSAQVYMYIAGSPEQLLADQGQLYAFVSDDAAINDYGDMKTGMHVSGRFIAVPRNIAHADQTVLENWSNDNNVFQFIRTEDMAYDKNNPRVLYIADTGEARALPDAATGRLRRGPSGTVGPYPNGRVFKMTFNVDDPRKVDRLEILIDADAAGVNPMGLHNPDNMDTSAGSLMIQEDPTGPNVVAAGAGPNARIWRYDLRNGTLSVVAEVDQSRDPKARASDWESSGIVDASGIFGPGAWLVDVQAHSLWVETQPAEQYTRKLEGGQLLIFTVPGS